MSARSRALPSVTFLLLSKRVLSLQVRVGAGQSETPDGVESWRSPSPLSSTTVGRCRRPGWGSRTSAGDERLAGPETPVCIAWVLRENSATARRLFWGFPCSKVDGFCQSRLS